jgi:hypothetical protein
MCAWTLHSLVLRRSVISLVSMAVADRMLDHLGLPQNERLKVK